MTILLEGNYDLINANLALGIGFAAIAPAIPQFDAMLYGTFGLGPMALDFDARLQAALGVSFEWNPTLAVQAMADITAGILAGAILPTFAVQANAELAADLQAKLLGINALIDASLAVKLPMVNALAALDAAAHLGIAYVVHEGTPATFTSEVPTELKGLLGISDVEPLYTITLAVTAAADFNTLATMFLV